MPQLVSNCLFSKSHLMEVPGIFCSFKQILLFQSSQNPPNRQPNSLPSLESNQKSPSARPSIIKLVTKFKSIQRKFLMINFSINIIFPTTIHLHNEWQTKKYDPNCEAKNINRGPIQNDCACFYSFTSFFSNFCSINR